MSDNKKYEFVKASDELPPLNLKVIIRPYEGDVYEDETHVGWDTHNMDYEWLKEVEPVEQDIDKFAVLPDKQELGEWQICPKCNGQGIVSKPPYVAGDIDHWSSSSTSHSCDVCNGAKVLARPIITLTS